MKYSLWAMALFSLLFVQSCHKQESAVATTNTEGKLIDLQTEDLSYGINGVTHRPYAMYDKNAKGPLPVVFVLPEWWGINDYIKDRVKQVASLGYYAVAVDYYGEAKEVTTVEEAQKLSSHFYQVPIDARRMFDAVKNRMAQSEIADYNKMAVIGYCFGGAQALNMGRLSDDFKGVVSFHGNLMTGIKPNNSSVKYLVLNGADDNFVSKEEIAKFEKQMDSAKIDYKMVHYPGALHAFTNPSSTETGKKLGLDIAYNKEADEKSWNEMKVFLEEIFK